VNPPAVFFVWWPPPPLVPLLCWASDGIAAVDRARTRTRTSAKVPRRPVAICGEEWIAGGRWDLVARCGWMGEKEREVSKEPGVF
jgi:hypothetical protein